MIKQWQKAALGVMAGAAVYGGYLSHLAAHTAALNQAAAKVRQEQAERQQLLTAIAVENKNIAVLRASLDKVRAHTVHVKQELHTVDQQIQQLQAGKQVRTTAVSSITGVKSSASSSPALMQLPSTQPPPVQSVTKAS